MQTECCAALVTFQILYLDDVKESRRSLAALVTAIYGRSADSGSIDDIICLLHRIIVESSTTAACHVSCVLKIGYFVKIRTIKAITYFDNFFPQCVVS